MIISSEVFDDAVQTGHQVRTGAKWFGQRVTGYDPALFTRKFAQSINHRHGPTQFGRAQFHSVGFDLDSDTGTWI